MRQLFPSYLDICLFDITLTRNACFVQEWQVLGKGHPWSNFCPLRVLLFVSSVLGALARQGYFFYRRSSHSCYHRDKAPCKWPLHSPLPNPWTLGHYVKVAVDHYDQMWSLPIKKCLCGQVRHQKRWRRKVAVRLLLRDFFFACSIKYFLNDEHCLLPSAIPSALFSKCVMDTWRGKR